MDNDGVEADLLSTRAGLARAVFEARMAFIGRPATHRKGDADAWESVAAASLGGGRAGRTLQETFEERAGEGKSGNGNAVRDAFERVEEVLRGANRLRSRMREELAGGGAAWARVDENGLPLMPWEPAADIEAARARAKAQCARGPRST